MEVVKNKSKCSMTSKNQLDKFRFTTRNTLTSIALVASAFIWYFLAIRALDSIIAGFDYYLTALIWTIHFVGMIIFALAGPSLAARVGDRKRFLQLWMIYGTISSAISIAVDRTYAPNVLLLSFLFGSSLGLGMPSLMGFFTENTKVENRGRVGGVMLLITGVGIASFGTLAPVENIELQISLLSALRIFGLAVLLLFVKKMNSHEKTKTPSYGSFLGQKPFLFYLIPWIMFSLITYLAAPIQMTSIGEDTANTLLSLENVVIGVSALVGGFMLDIVGRKRIAIAGFVLLGLGYAVLGLGDPTNLLSWCFYTVVDGVAWAMLFVTFVVCIWGDLSHDAPSERHYAVGVLPFFVSKWLQYTIGGDIARAILPTSLFSFIAFFLFIAILPLVYAPETLPEKVLKDRELKTYLQKAQEIAAKAHGRDEEAQEEDEDSVKFEVPQRDAEEAEELAQKYY